ncbi:receptor-like protein kinase ANXUR2 [Lathyrus oleraceus]|uniref:receptor-like protein kinase ANXUR2 n=1 Tax=Pisum sativum TaxID=3888 RepID=UPI0021D36A21|nr:receptor-like protein kinase ANXUR2 [Pisum sativum]
MIVAAANSHNPTLVGALTRLQRCAFSRSREIQIIDAQALTTNSPIFKLPFNNLSSRFGLGSEVLHFAARRINLQLRRQRFVIYCREIDGIAGVTTRTGLAVPENHCCYSFCMFGNETGLGMQLVELVSNSSILVGPKWLCQCLPSRRGFYQLFQKSFLRRVCTLELGSRSLAACSLYGSFSPSDSYFSVATNRIILLTNFSAYITCEALSLAYIDREYSLAPLNSDTLTLTFKPFDKQKGVFAFVNGIQLIPIPELFDSAALVGYVEQKVEVKSMRLQTMFRLNVGGQYVSPAQDSGLSRMWYDDTPYLYGASTGVTNKATKDVQINYQTMPQYIAPETVYSTSRSMGNDKNANIEYKLTWIFQVDPNSMYLVRLHFYEYYYSKVNEIVFNILINNQTAEPQVDVIGWTGGKGVPTYKDYVIHVQDSDVDEKLWLALQPTPETKPEFYDAILNEVEIFKLNDTDLSGPNPQPSDMLLEDQAEERGFQTHEGYNRKVVIGGAAGGAAGFAFMAAICITVFNKKKRVLGSSTNTSWLPIYENSHINASKSMSGKSIASANLAAMAQGLCRYFSLQEIKQATKSFDESLVIGVWVN